MLWTLAVCKTAGGERKAIPTVRDPRHPLRWCTLHASGHLCLAATLNGPIFPIVRSTDCFKQRADERCPVKSPMPLPAASWYEARLGLGAAGLIIITRSEALIRGLEPMSAAHLISRSAVDYASSQAEQHTRLRLLLFSLLRRQSLVVHGHRVSRRRCMLWLCEGFLLPPMRRSCVTLAASGRDGL